MQFLEGAMSPTELLQRLADQARAAVNPKIGLFQSLESTLLHVITQYPEYRDKLLPTLRLVGTVIVQESAVVCTDRMYEQDKDA